MRTMKYLIGGAVALLALAACAADTSTLPASAEDTTAVLQEFWDEAGASGQSQLCEGYDLGADEFLNVLDPQGKLDSGATLELFAGVC